MAPFSAASLASSAAAFFLASLSRNALAPALRPSSSEDEAIGRSGPTHRPSSSEDEPFESQLDRELDRKRDWRKPAGKCGPATLGPRPVHASEPDGKPERFRDEVLDCDDGQSYDDRDEKESEPDRLRLLSLGSLGPIAGILTLLRD
ncbi:hypothetical protein NDA18_005173 [Ustilago nuda]|nr:hypothetical protein NDA18_005173 [Ustilago nuda]